MFSTIFYFLLSAYLLSLGYYILTRHDDELVDPDTGDLNLFRGHWAWLKETSARLVAALYDNEYGDRK